MKSMDSRLLAATRNNAEWCDLVSPSDGATTRFDGGAWTSGSRTPPYDPDAVTPVPAIRAASSPGVDGG